MNEIKELCELTLDTPAPPLPDATTAIAAARRAVRRRTRITVATAGLAVLAATVATVTVTSGLAGRPASGGVVIVPGAGPTATTPPPPPPMPPAPMGESVHAHGPAITAILIDALPSGFTGEPDNHGGTNTHGGRCVDGCSGYTALTSVRVLSGDRRGSLSTYFSNVDDRSLPPGDLCSAPVTEWLGSPDTLNEPAPLSCQVITVDGVAIRVTTSREHLQPALGLILTATRPLQNGLLQVITSEGTLVVGDDELPADRGGSGGSGPAPARPGPNHPPALAGLVFTAEQIAALAADPVLLP